MSGFDEGLNNETAKTMVQSEYDDLWNAFGGQGQDPEGFIQLLENEHRRFPNPVFDYVPRDAVRAARFSWAGEARRQYMLASGMPWMAVTIDTAAAQARTLGLKVDLSKDGHAESE